jgi:hypothetical protein
MKALASVVLFSMASLTFASPGPQQPGRPPAPTAFVPPSGVEVPLRLVR